MSDTYKESAIVSRTVLSLKVAIAVTQLCMIANALILKDSQINLMVVFLSVYGGLDGLFWLYSVAS